MKTVLVSGASGIVGYGILRSLRGLGYRLIGTTIYEVSPANCFSDIVLQPPLTSDPRYMDWLIGAIKQYRINMIIPGIEADMRVWNQNRARLEETGAVVLLNNSRLIDFCLDKWVFYSKLKENHFDNCIESSLLADFGKFSLPFILKPRCGFGSKGIVKVNERETFDQFKDKIGSDLMMQEFVGTDNEEYTVSAFFDINSQAKAMLAMRRKLSKQGFTEIAQVVDVSETKDIVLKLAEIFKPVGPTNFQFRRDKGKFKLLEINPRVSSSTSLKTAFGYNECKMAVEYFLEGKDILEPTIRKGRGIRYTEDFVIYDDCPNI